MGENLERDHLRFRLHPLRKLFDFSKRANCPTLSKDWEVSILDNERSGSGCEWLFQVAKALARIYRLKLFSSLAPKIRKWRKSYLQGGTKLASVRKLPRTLDSQFCTPWQLLELRCALNSVCMARSNPRETFTKPRERVWWNNLLFGGVFPKSTKFLLVASLFPFHWLGMTSQLFPFNSSRVGKKLITLVLRKIYMNANLTTLTMMRAARGLQMSHKEKSCVSTKEQFVVGRLVTKMITILQSCTKNVKVPSWSKISWNLTLFLH